MESQACAYAVKFMYFFCLNAPIRSHAYFCLKLEFCAQNYADVSTCTHYCTINMDDVCVCMYVCARTCVCVCVCARVCMCVYVYFTYIIQRKLHFGMILSIQSESSKHCICVRKFHTYVHIHIHILSGLSNESCACRHDNRL